MTVVSELLGHSHINLTVKRYGRFTSDAKIKWEAVALLDVDAPEASPPAPERAKAPERKLGGDRRWEARAHDQCHRRPSLTREQQGDQLDIAPLLALLGARSQMRSPSAANLKFIDLFAGLGGFHQALAGLGHECVFACEINEELAKLYEQNFGIKPAGDIRKVDLASVPKHDILCAGFPCQPFSKAGDQRGLECPQWGDLIDYVVQILRRHQPQMFVIENVPNLVRHNGGTTWTDIKNRLSRAGYSVKDSKLSPHMFGVPQIRERAFIVGRRGGLEGFEWPVPKPPSTLSVFDILDKNPQGARPLTANFIEYLTAWQAFIDAFPSDEELPSYPIWAMEFGATYPYTKQTPYAHGFSSLSRHAGSFGQTLAWLSPEQVKEALPPYARYAENAFPDWKIDFIQKNRDLYRRHQQIIDAWLPRIRGFAPSFQKLEWNCKGGHRNIWNYLIQFRASGIRVKQTTKAPSLVAMTTSQVPVVAWERRFMTARECSRLQSMGGLEHLPAAQGPAFKALGNAVNVTVVAAIVEQLTKVSQTSGKSLSGPRSGERAA